MVTFLQLSWINTYSKFDALKLRDNYFYRVRKIHSNLNEKGKEIKRFKDWKIQKSLQCIFEK